MYWFNRYLSQRHKILLRANFNPVCTHHTVERSGMEMKVEIHLHGEKRKTVNQFLGKTLFWFDLPALHHNKNSARSRADKTLVSLKEKHQSKSPLLPFPWSSTLWQQDCALLTLSFKKKKMANICISCLSLCEAACFTVGCLSNCANQWAKGLISRVCQMRMQWIGPFYCSVYFTSRTIHQPWWFRLQTESF